MPLATYSPAPLATTLAAFAFADHVTKCCILIGRAKNVPIIYAENGRHIENSARFEFSNAFYDQTKQQKCPIFHYQRDPNCISFQ